MSTDITSLQNKPEAVIQQINLGYNAQQDRLLLKVGLADNSELLVWLTYSVTKQLWQMLTGETHLPTATSIKTESPQQAVAQFNQELKATESLQKMDFATDYQPRKAVVNDGAMLALCVLLVHYANKPTSLEMPCLEGITVRMNLTQELILALCKMLQLSSQEAAWDLGVTGQINLTTDVNASIETDLQAKKTLH